METPLNDKEANVGLSDSNAGLGLLPIAINDNVTGTEVENFRLQDGEEAHRCVYDGREISVSEILK